MSEPMSDRRSLQAAGVDRQALQDELTQAYHAVADAKLKRRIAEEQWRKANVGCQHCLMLQEQLDAANRQIAELKKALEFECSSHFTSDDNEQPEVVPTSRPTRRTSARYTLGTTQPSPRSGTAEETMEYSRDIPPIPTASEATPTNSRKRKKNTTPSRNEEQPQAQAHEASAIPPLTTFTASSMGEKPAQNQWLRKLFAHSVSKANGSTELEKDAPIPPTETSQESVQVDVPAATSSPLSEDSGDNPILKSHNQLKTHSRKKHVPREYFSGGQRRWKCSKVIKSGPNGDILCERRAVSFSVGLCHVHRK